MTSQPKESMDEAAAVSRWQAIQKAVDKKLRAMWPERIEEARLDSTELLQMAKSFTVLEPKRGGPDGVTVERRIQGDGSVLWGVYRSERCCLTKDGIWEYERLPSNREDDFYTRCRWETLGLALAAAKVGAQMIQAEWPLMQECAAEISMTQEEAT